MSFGALAAACALLVPLAVPPTCSPSAARMRYAVRFTNIDVLAAVVGGATGAATCRRSSSLLALAALLAARRPAGAQPLVREERRR